MQFSGPGSSPSARRDRVTTAAVHLFLAGAIVHAVVNFWWHASDFIVEQHGFRQTQTAITTYWMLRDGFHFAYLTPVLGAPWSIPFEFPLFQVLTAYVVKLGGLPLDTAGRTTSFVFFLATLWPMYLLGRWLELPRRFFAFAAILYCCSPLYLFWGRTFLIESLALFLALVFLAMALRELSADRAPSLTFRVLLPGVATLALVVKVTTAAAPFVLVSGVLLAKEVRARLRSGGGAMEKMMTIPAGSVISVVIALTIALAGQFVWTRFADSLKAQSSLTTVLQSAALHTWTFGTVPDRLGSELWRGAVLGRAIPESIGVGLLCIAVVVFAHRLSPRCRLAVFGAVAMFLGGFLLFPRLHIVHNYYQYANSIFLLLACAVVLASLSESRPVLALLLVFVIAAFQLRGFAKGYGLVEGSVKNPMDSRNLQVSGAIKKRVDANAAFLGFGLTWSSEVPYYSERRAVLIPISTMATDVVGDPASFLGGVPLGAVVICPEFQAPDEVKTKVAALTAGATREEIAGCELFSNLPTRR